MYIFNPLKKIELEKELKWRKGQKERESFEGSLSELIFKNEWK